MEDYLSRREERDIKKGKTQERGYERLNGIKQTQRLNVIRGRRQKETGIGNNQGMFGRNEMIPMMLLRVKVATTGEERN